MANRRGGEGKEERGERYIKERKFPISTGPKDREEKEHFRVPSSAYCLIRVY